MLAVGFSLGFYVIMESRLGALAAMRESWRAVLELGLLRVSAVYLAGFIGVLFVGAISGATAAVLGAPPQAELLSRLVLAALWAGVTALVVAAVYDRRGATRSAGRAPDGRAQPLDSDPAQRPAHQRSLGGTDPGDDRLPAGAMREVVGEIHAGVDRQTAARSVEAPFRPVGEAQRRRSPLPRLRRGTAGWRWKRTAKGCGSAVPATGERMSSPRNSAPSAAR